MKRAIQRLIQDPLALKLINGEFSEGDTVAVDAASGGGELQFTKLVPVEVQVAPGPEGTPLPPVVLSGRERTPAARPPALP